MWGESDRTVRIDKIRLGPLNHPNKMDMDRIFGFVKTRQPISGPVETACHGSTRIFLGGKSFLPYVSVLDFVMSFFLSENYIILREYIKCVLPPLIDVVGLTMNLISGTYDFCERKKYAFNVIPKYSIIILSLTYIQTRLFTSQSFYFKNLFSIFSS